MGLSAGALAAAGASGPARSEEIAVKKIIVFILLAGAAGAVLPELVKALQNSRHV